MLFVSSTFAESLTYKTMQEWRDALEANEIIIHNRYTPKPMKLTMEDTNLISKTVSRVDESLELYQQIEQFFDLDFPCQKEPGTLKGEFINFSLKGKADTRFLIVHYFPGENDYGSIYLIKKNNKETSYKLIYDIRDADIYPPSPIVK